MVLYNDTRSKNVESEITLLDFQRLVINEWCGIDKDSGSSGNESTQVDESVKKSRSRYRQSSENDLTTRTTGAHFPYQIKNKYDSEGKCIEDNRNRCKYCNMNTLFKCEDCDVYLCIPSDEISRNCFRLFHSEEKFSLKPSDFKSKGKFINT